MKYGLDIVRCPGTLGLILTPGTPLIEPGMLALILPIIPAPGMLNIPPIFIGMAPGRLMLTMGSAVNDLLVALFTVLLASCPPSSSLDTWEQVDM